MDNDGNVYFYKKGNIKKVGGRYIVQLWEKKVLSDKNREEYIQNRKNNGFSTEGWDKMSNVQS
ncbi:MAG: hypothetical protein L7F78_08475 [Syntrophales bacterium LBB04]|nr:hypothetical protein [Syntrophales bacterium LBB04]